jgi:superfamily II DNA/RNA helicase
MPGYTTPSSTPARGRRPAPHGRPQRRPSSAARRPRPVADQATVAMEAALDAAAAAPEPAERSFADLGLPSRLVAAMAQAGLHTPFAIQRRTLPDALAGHDVLGRAQTGSGKTLGFGLPVLARLEGARSRTKAPRGLVLVPTRELAQQVAGALTPLASALDLRVTTVYGGAPIGRQIADLERGVDVVVATPGRLIDLMERRSIVLDRVEVTVLDEADYMADLGFMPAVQQIMGATPDGGQRMLFSATLDRGVGTLVQAYLVEPKVHAVAAATAQVSTMDHRVLSVRNEHKVAVATEVAGRPGRTLFFVRTKLGADRLTEQLTTAGVPATTIHGNLNQSARQRSLAQFTSGHRRVLVATDVAARGIHVDDVDLVVHYDPPNDHKDYLHRSGRTARAGSSGTVVSLVNPGQLRTMARLHAEAGVTARTTAVAPGHDEVREIATSGEPVVLTEMPRQERSWKGRPRRQGQHRPAGQGGSGQGRSQGGQGRSSQGGYRQARPQR